MKTNRRTKVRSNTMQTYLNKRRKYLASEKAKADREKRGIRKKKWSRKVPHKPVVNRELQMTANNLPDKFETADQVRKECEFRAKELTKGKSVKTRKLAETIGSCNSNYSSCGSAACPYCVNTYRK